MESQQSVRNGVDVARLKETVGAIQQNPELAKCTFRATNTWISGGHNQARIRDFYGAGEDRTHRQNFSMEVDEPPLLLGEDLGPNPVEYVLSALSGCLTSSLVYHAAARGIDIEEVESHLEGDLDLRGFLGLAPDVRNGYNNINVTFRIKADAPQEEIDELIKLARDRSPVFDIVSHPVNVTVTAQKMEEGATH